MFDKLFIVFRHLRVRPTGSDRRKVALRLALGEVALLLADQLAAVLLKPYCIFFIILLLLHPAVAKECEGMYC